MNKFNKILMLLSATTLLHMLPNAASAAETGAYDTSFDKVATYANMNALARRLTHGLSYRGIVEEARKKKIDLGKYSVDPRQEKWHIHVPEQPAENGKYGVLVWISDEEKFETSKSLRDTLEAEGVILVAPHNATADRDRVFERSALGLHGLNYVIASGYPVDPSRLFVGGSDSGAVVAEGLALGYGDVFQAALLFGEVALPGSEQMPVPAPGVFERVSQRSHFVISPSDDVDKDALANAFAKRLCISEIQWIDRTNESMPSGEQLRIALESLSRKVSRDTADCMNQRQMAAQEAIKKIEALIDEDKGKEAIAETTEAHQQYGALIETDILRIVDVLRTEFVRAFKEADMQAKEIYQQGQTQLRDIPRPDRGPSGGSDSGEN